VAISEAVKQNIQQKIQQETALQNIQIEEAVEEELIGGFMLEFDNNLLDASILRDLKDVQKQFNENLYVPNIR
jgi:F-type H+-transporting ATPase subunit delta